MTDDIRHRSVLVIGGAGGVGTAITRALLQRCDFARVIATSRSAEKLAKLRTTCADASRLITIVGDVATSARARTLRSSACSHGELGAVVASLGGWWQGPHLMELDERVWNDTLATLLTTHFIAARTFVPALGGDGCRYLAIGGGAARTPVPGSGLVSIAGAAQLMLLRTIVAERSARSFPVIEELVIDGPVATDAIHHGARREREMNASEVGEIVAAMLVDGTTATWPHVERDGPIVTVFARD